MRIKEYDCSLCFYVVLYVLVSVIRFLKQIIIKDKGIFLTKHETSNKSGDNRI